MTNQIKIAVIGALTIDINKIAKGEYKYIGGGGFYCSKALSRMGAKVTLFTAYGGDMNESWILSLKNSGVEIVAENVEKSIIFENSYEGDKRIQKAYDNNYKIFVDKLILKNFDAVHITPVLNEIDQNIFNELNGLSCKVSIECHGFIRKVGKNNDIFNTKSLLQKNALSKVDYVHIGFEEQMFFLDHDISELFRINPKMIVELTYPLGSFILNKNSCFYVPSLKRPVIDPTGAGDVYSAVFLMKHIETKDLLKSGLWASGAASIKIEKPPKFFDLNPKEIEIRVKEIEKLCI
ncbi:MAG: hypothetical protein CVU81_00445 [Euryarchaeota archaeon HGW-Euryarchaeota-1]|nr:MAG: hypothetical protein CVU81_00445 [Euryarchaeota archaeon HGW-Euryarchaeota-1]